MAQLKIQLVRSLNNVKKPQVAVAASLGLHKPGDVTLQPDNDQTKGKVQKIIHLIEVSNA